MLESAGFVERHQDMLLDRRPVIAVADPMVRLHHLVIEPWLADLEAGRAGRVWQQVRLTVDSKILGPHLETLATEWVARYAAEEAGLAVGATGRATIACREHKTSHEIDILALEPGARPRTAGAAIRFIGEAKSRDRRPGLAELRRLEHIRDVLAAAEYDISSTVLGLFSSSGFTDDLRAQPAQQSSRVLLAGLDRLYAM